MLNTDGSIYHLHLLPGELASTIFLVGDPERVPLVSQYFDTIEIKKEFREFVTHTGTRNGFRISVVSTGIGTDNIDIVLNEADALHNIDFRTRSVRDFITPLQFIRIGTSGAIQDSIPVGSMLVSTMAAGFDALGLFYHAPQSTLCIDHSNELSYKLSLLVDVEMKPYLCHSSEALLAKVPAHFVKGITLTMPGFYAPQGRQLRAPGKVKKELLAFVQGLTYEGRPITNIEMETAGIYLLASVLGHQAISFNAILANRITDTFSTEPERVTDSLIREILALYC